MACSRCFLNKQVFGKHCITAYPGRRPATRKLNPSFTSARDQYTFTAESRELMIVRDRESDREYLLKLFGRIIKNHEYCVCPTTCNAIRSLLWALLEHAECHHTVCNSGSIARNCYIED